MVVFLLECAQMHCDELNLIKTEKFVGDERSCAQLSSSATPCAR